MPFFACALLLLLLPFASAPQSPATFPIPADMHEIWPGAKLTDADKQLLQKAAAPELHDENEDSRSGKKYSFESLDTADIALGTLGKGVIVLMSGSALCGTGGCPIYAYVHEKGEYKKVLGGEKKGAGPIGWAFTVVNSKTTIPDLVIARSNGGGQVALTLFRYSGDAFVPQACEILSAKNPTSTSSWWDPSQVSIEPCGQN
jgi:hypothetical protein